MIVWSEELREDTPTRHARDAKLPSAEQAWEDYEASWLALKRKYKPAPSTSLAAADGAIAQREPVASAHAGIISSFADRAQLDRALLALTSELGAGFAFEAWVASWRGERLTGSGSWKPRHEERILRPALLLASAAERAHAAEIARQVDASDYERASLSHRLVFDAAFAREVTEAALLRNFCAQHDADPSPWLIGAAPDLDVATKLVRAALPSWSPLGLTSLVDAFGVEAVPILIEVAQGPHHAKDAVRALCLVGLPSVAEVFADLLRLGPVRPRAIEFFARFPELASVLEPLAKQKTRHGKLAQSVLEGLPKTGTDAPRAEMLAIPAGVDEQLQAGDFTAVAAKLDAHERSRVAQVLRTRWQGVRDRKSDAWLGRAAIALADRALVARFAASGGPAKLLPLLAESTHPAAALAILRLSTRQDAVGQSARYYWANGAKQLGCSPDDLEEAATTALERETICEAGVELRLAVGRGFAPLLIDAHGEVATPPRSWSELSRELAKQLLADAGLLLERRPALYERAMQAGRRWSAEAFRAKLTSPIAAAFVRAIVWLVEEDEKKTTVRIAEDGTFADVDDQKVTPGSRATFGVAKPEEISGRWATVFADYELINPFGQLTPPV